MRILKYVLASLIAGGAIGFIPTYLQLRDARAQQTATAEQLNAELAEVREDLVLSDIHSRLGLLIQHVRQDNFVRAQALSTRLYDEIDQAMLVVADADAKRRLQTLAQTRDQVTAALARNEPQSLETLERLFGLLGGSL